MDVVFVNSMYFQELHTTDLGSIILRHRLDENIESQIVNFDRLIREGKINLEDDNEKIFDVFAEYIVKMNPKIVVFYTVCLTYPFTIIVAKRIKQILRDVKILFGGPQVSASPKYNMEKFDFVDVVGVGEGEPYFNDLIKALLLSKDLASIQSIAYRSQDAQIILNSKTKGYDFTKDYAGDYKNFDYGEEYSYFQNDHTKDIPIDIQIETGRGCPYNCSFCATSIFWDRKCKMKSPKLLISEMNEFQENYGFNFFSLDHDMFTANRSYIVEFCKLIIQLGVKWKWKCSSRLDCLDQDLIQFMRKANCYGIYSGVETGSQAMQIVLHKNLDISEVLSKTRKILEEGIGLTLSFIYGFYEETETDFLKTLSLIEKCYILGVNTIQLHKYFPLTNTEEWEKIKDKVYLDIEKSDMSISFNMDLLSGEVAQLIQDDAETFSCFYEFDTIVRQKYSRMDHLITCFTGMFSFYARTIQYLIKKYGLQHIYLSSENLIFESAKRFHFRNVHDSFYRKHEVEYMHDLVRNIIEGFLKKTDNRYLRGISKFDENIYLYCFYGLSEPVVFSTECDVTSATENDILTYYRISMIDQALDVEKLILNTPD